MTAIVNLDNCAINTKNKMAFIFEGGGTKGIYSLGILKYLFRTDNPFVDLNKVFIFGGTSVGSYIAAALSLGYDLEELERFMDKLSISELIDPWYYFPITISRLLKSGYMYESKGRKKILDNIFMQIIDRIKTDLKLDIKYTDITFSHLKTLITEYPGKYKNLVVNAVDLNNSEQIFFSTLNDYSNELSIYDALMASSAIPFVFEPTIAYRKEKYFFSKNIENSKKIMLIDGGTANNNPLDYFMIDIKDYDGIDFYLLKYNSPSEYKEINSIYTAFERIGSYMLTERNNVNMEVISDFFDINIINLHVDNSPLYIPTEQEIKDIIVIIENQCKSNKIDKINKSPNTFVKN